MTDPGAFVPIGSENDRRRLSHHGNPTRASRTSASGWHGHQPVKVVPDFHRLLTPSGNNVSGALGQTKRIDGGVERFHTPIYLPIPSETRPSCTQRNGVCTQGIKEIFITHSYVHLISGDGIFPLCQSAGGLPTVKPASSQVSPAPRCNRKVIE